MARELSREERMPGCSAGAPPAQLRAPWRRWAWCDIYWPSNPGQRRRYWQAERYGTSRPGSPHTSVFVRVETQWDLLCLCLVSVRVSASRGCLPDCWEAIGAPGDVDQLVAQAVAVLGDANPTPP